MTFFKSIQSSGPPDMPYDDRYKLAGQKVIITGGMGLLGSHFARTIASEGGVPVILDLDMAGVDTVKNQLKQYQNIEPEIYQCDITEFHQFNETMTKIFSGDIGPRISLVNNAARNPKYSGQRTSPSTSRFETYPIDEWQMDLSVGLTGAFLVTQSFVKNVFEKEMEGNVVNISSDLGLIAPNHSLYSNNPDQLTRPTKPISYSVVKTGIIGLTKYLATYAPNYVRSNALCFGGIYEDQPEEFVEKITRLIPKGRMAYPDDYQSALLYLLSESSDYMTGAVLTIDGGRTSW